MEYIYQTSDSAPRLFPAIRLFGNFFKADGFKEERMIAKSNNPQSEWGEAHAPILIGRKAEALPKAFSIGWLSVTEQKCYGLAEEIDQTLMEREWNRKDDEGTGLFQYLVLGMAPYGGVALWLRGETKSVIIGCYKAFDMTNEELTVKRFLMGRTPADICKEYLATHETVANHLSTAGLPQAGLFDHWMQQFHYRLLPLEEYWDGEQWQEYNEDDLYYDDTDITVLEVQRYDGTHDQSNDFTLLRYHEAGMPRRLKVKWSVGHDDFSAYYWMDDQLLWASMNRFTMLLPDTRITMLLRIDTRRQRYELALKGDDDSLPQPVTLPQEACQLLVFVNGNELYRSDNFNQPDGGWNW